MPIPTWSKQDQKVPFDEAGNQLVHVYRYDQADTWRDNWVFKADLKFLKLTTGRSAARALVEVHPKGQDSFTAFLTQKEFAKLLLDLELETGGWMKGGMYTFVKRGANYHLTRVSKKS